MAAVLVDSNLWIAYLDARHEWHPTVAKDLPDRLRGQRIVCPTVVKMEVLHHARHQLDGPAGQAVHDWLAMDADSPALDDATVDAAFHHLTAHHEAVGARDAAILAHLAATGATLVTADEELAKVAQAMGLAVDAFRP